MMHGEDDEFIPDELGRETASRLLLQGLDVQFRTFPNIAHELEEEEVSFHL